MSHHDDRHDARTDQAHDCADCPLVAPRRAFLRDAFALAAATTLGPLLSACRAAGLPVGETSAYTSAGDGRSYTIPAGDGAQIDRANQVILVRWQGSVYAFNLSCPHQNTALRWNQASSRFQCPKHRSQYTPSGEFIAGRATRGMDRLAIRQAGNAVVVDVDRLYRQDSDPAGWAAAVVKVA